MSKKRNPIKCTFFGYTLAETKRNKIIRFLKKNNYDFEETYDYKIIVRDITFEGFHCKKVKLDFCRETIWSIDADLGVFEDENLFKSTYDKLSTTFNNKYGNHCIIKDDYGCAYEDDDMLCDFICRDKHIEFSYTVTNVDVKTLNIMKKHHWHLILENNITAPKTGVYLFAIRNNYDISYECHKLKEGDSFYGVIGASTAAPTDNFVPVAYHFCKEYIDSNSISKSSCITDSSWRQCVFDSTSKGLRVVAFTLNGALTYAISESSVFFFEKEESFTYKDTHLSPWWGDEMKIQQDIKILAYHYIEFFGNVGSSYWWYKYRKIHSDENEMCLTLKNVE